MAALGPFDVMGLVRGNTFCRLRRGTGERMVRGRQKRRLKSRRRLSDQTSVVMLEHLVQGVILVFF